MSPAVWKRSLVARLVLYFLLLSQMTVALVGWTAFLRARTALEETILARLEMAADLEATGLQQWLEDQSAAFALLDRLPDVDRRLRAAIDPAADPAVRDEALRELDSLFKTLVEGHSGWRELMVLTANSRIALATEPSLVGEYRIDAHYFILGREGGYQPEIYPSPTTSGPAITLARPISLPSRDGAAGGAGALVLHLDLDRMDEIVLERGFGSGIDSYLIDKYKVLLSSERFGREEYPRGLNSLGVNEVVEGSSGSDLYDDYRGVPVLGVYRWLDELKVGLLVEIPQSEAFAPARRLAIWIVLLGLALAVVLALVTYLLARQIARPVLRITETAIALAEGDLSARAPEISEDETGVLARTFNQMAARLETLYRELESRAAELERFTYTVSHDLKSPLFTIRGFLGLLQRDVASGNSERMRHDIERIETAAAQMQQLLDELLELSQIGRVANPSEDVELAELAREAAAQLHRAIEERGVELIVPPELPEVFGDRLRLREVFQNLISNGIKFLGPQDAPRIEVDAVHRDGMILCTVRDNGIGIATCYHEKIFGLFERLNASVEGTGVGLPLVRRIVEVHGGKIWVESEPDVGSTFFFTLPPGHGA